MDRPISFLSKMMIERSKASLLKKNYEDALECILTVAAIDSHPEVTTALVMTVLDIIKVLKPKTDVSAVKARLAEYLAHSEFDLDYNYIRECFDRDMIQHILDLTRSQRGWFRPRSRVDDVTTQLISNINKITSGDGAEIAKFPSESLGARADRRRQDKTAQFLHTNLLIHLRIYDLVVNTFRSLINLIAISNNKTFRNPPIYTISYAMSASAIVILFLCMICFYFVSSGISDIEQKQIVAHYGEIRYSYECRSRLGIESMIDASPDIPNLKDEVRNLCNEPRIK